MVVHQNLSPSGLYSNGPQEGHKSHIVLTTRLTRIIFFLILHLHITSVLTAWSFLCFSLLFEVPSLNLVVNYIYIYIFFHVSDFFCVSVCSHPRSIFQPLSLSIKPLFSTKCTTQRLMSGLLVLHHQGQTHNVSCMIHMHRPILSCQS